MPPKSEPEKSPEPDSPDEQARLSEAFAVLQTVHERVEAEKKKRDEEAKP